MSKSSIRILETSWLEDRINYTGMELRSHFIREAAGIVSDGVVAFAGSCDVSGDSLVDLEDAMQGSFIKAELMLHFIGEHFDCTSREGNFRLRLFASVVKETIEEQVPGTALKRVGDDLFAGKRKLTVAISTMTPVSSIFHFGINIDPAGAPVPAVGLEELGLDAAGMAGAVLERYREECEGVELAVRKVKGRL
jgi:hypothetical protein